MITHRLSINVQKTSRLTAFTTEVAHEKWQWASARIAAEQTVDRNLGKGAAMADEFNPQGVDQTPRNNENPNSTADTGNAEPKNPFVGGDSG